MSDVLFMRMALRLARRGEGAVNPNPVAGAVVVQGERVVGKGYHRVFGGPHAEVEALDQAGALARGATLYVTLEPCPHHGKTPPCTERILEAGIARVVFACEDPNPLVRGKGLARLRDAGVEVAHGVLAAEARRQNEIFFKFITTGLPFVTLKLAMSLDGRIATRTGDSRWISSRAAREYVHLLRGENDAIMTGVGTVLKDDPLLTVRHPNWRGKRITRVILDSGLRFPLRARMLSTLSRGKILIFAAPGARPARIEALRKKGVEVLIIPATKTGLDLREALAELGKREITGLLVESGAHLATSLLEEKLADKVFLTLSPLLTGGERARSFFEGTGARTIGDALHIRRFTHFTIGRDIIMEGYL